MAVLEISDLALHFKTKKGLSHAVKNISLQVNQGEALGLVGESGCGKSTVAYAAMGHLDSNARISKGQIRFKGQDLLTLSKKALRKLWGKEMTMVYQDPMTTLNPCYQVGLQLQEVLKVHMKLSGSEAYDKSKAMLQQVRMPDPDGIMNRFPHQLSGGQQQRVIIALALLCNPSLLIMDEPTTALDVTVEATILDHIKELREELDVAILCISHNLGAMAQFCDRIAVMYSGELVETASVYQLFEEPKHPYTQGLISCLPTMDSCRHTNRLQGIPGQVWSGDILPTGCIFHPRCSYSSDLCSTQPSFQEKDGHGVRCWHWKELDIKKTFNPLKSSGKIPDLSDKTATLLKVENLKTFYKERSASMFKKDSASYVKAVNQVSFEVEKGGIVGIVGESGCGKSSLAKSIAGLEEPTAGIIELSGLDIAQRVESRNITTLQKLNMIFQNPDSSLNPTKTVGQSLRRALKLNKALVGKKKQEAELERLMEAIRIDKSYLERKPWQLSGGEKQRIAIARALASHPELLICDEPVSALDVSVQCSVINTLLDIRNRYGTSLLFISHDLAVVRYFCDQIIVMYLGKICEQSQASEITKPPYHPYTEALLSAAPITDLKIKQKRIHLEGTPPSPSNPPKGCFFHTRCHRKNGKACSQELPPLQISKSGKKIFCHRPLEILESFEPILNN